MPFSRAIFLARGLANTLPPGAATGGEGEAGVTGWGGGGGDGAGGGGGGGAAAAAGSAGFSYKKKKVGKHKSKWNKLPWSLFIDEMLVEVIL